ncbi:MAG: ABC transporter permease [Chloroflexota bacterium]|jgi:ABC-2 type transport system permease protein
MLNSLFGFFIRTSAFIRKEIYEILRQTRLVFTLILGPFLILFLFGIGYSETPRTLQTLFVIPEGSELTQWVEEHAESITPHIQVADIIDDADEADRRLRRQEVDLVVVAPPTPYEMIRENRHAVFYLYHYEIDPYEITYVQVLGRAYTNEINNRVLAQIADEAKIESESMQDNMGFAQESAAAMRRSFEQGDAAAAELHRGELNEDIRFLRFIHGSGLAILTGIQQTVGAPVDDEAGTIIDSATRVQSWLDSIDNIDASETDFSREAEVAGEIEEELARIDVLLTEFRSIDSRILVSPFDNEIVSITETVIQPTHFFIPAVIALLLQHIAVTLAALSIVREQRDGAMELFRAAPITAFETLLGKYVSYWLLSAFLAAILTALMIFLLGMPMLGAWDHYSAMIAMLLFTSLGVGFNFSLSAQTDSQAVQYSMILLLASIFFSGLFLASYRLWLPVRLFSWILPATYGTSLLQSVMLRGQGANLLLQLGLLLFGLILFLTAWWRLKRLMSPE